MDYKILENINFPSDIRNLKKNDLIKLAEELRQKTIELSQKQVAI